MKNLNRFCFLKILLLPIGALLILGGCSHSTDIKDVIRNDKNSFYYIDLKNYPTDDNSLPIGVFDSGTGGLSVLADIVKHEGLTKESYIFLGDLANMPYGSYSLENNTELLIEHVMKDVQFLLGNKYYQKGDSPKYQTDKSKVKVIVIACNTATAYALDTVRNFLADAGSDIGVIGVIDAGAQGAFGNFSTGENGSIAVMATDGTVKSGAYPAIIKSINLSDGQEEFIPVFQQAGIGIAEAIDESIDAIDRKATGPRTGYKGPTETAAGEIHIDLRLWERYNFDLANAALLFDGDAANPHIIQINSVENYIKFHLVSLMEKIRKSEGAPPLNSVVLACTHYPFYLETFRSELMRLRDYRENGEYIYRDHISEDFILVNPASVVAEQLYAHLTAKGLLSSTAGPASEFYVSVPNLLNRGVSLRDDGSFTYEYKYGRKAGEIKEYIRVVPFSRTTIPGDILSRLSQHIPEVYDMMAGFNHGNPKTQFLTEDERIVRE